MSSRYLALATGFAMFSMFFGSGNLVFPVEIGVHSGAFWPLAAAGLFLTGVLGPFLGLLCIVLYDGKTRDFFSTLGNWATLWIPLIALSLMGPFGVLARCITVAHGALHIFWADLTLPSFSLAFCAVILILCLRRDRIVPLLGAVLTPGLLLALGAITVAGFSYGDAPRATELGSWEAFTDGIYQGYQTMDLVAAFFFSAFVVGHLKRSGEKQLLPVFIRSSLVGVGLLASVYISLVGLGAIYSDQLRNVAPQELLGAVAEAALGPWSALILGVAVTLACLTTAITLTTLFADFVRQELMPSKTPPLLSLALTLVIAFTVSTLEFSGIAAFLAPILSTMYPALIVLALCGIAHKLWGFSFSPWPAFATLPAKLLIGF